MDDPLLGSPARSAVVTAMLPGAQAQLGWRGSGGDPGAQRDTVTRHGNHGKYGFILWEYHGIYHVSYKNMEYYGISL